MAALSVSSPSGGIYRKKTYLVNDRKSEEYLPAVKEILGHREIETACGTPVWLRHTSQSRLSEQTAAGKSAAKAQAGRAGTPGKV